MSQTLLRAFKPVGATQNIAVTASAQALTLNNLIGTRTIRLFNSGTLNVFVDFTTGANSATTTTSIPIAPGSVELFTIASDVSTVSVLSSGTGNTLYTTIGEGL